MNQHEMAGHLGEQMVRGGTDALLAQGTVDPGWRREYYGASCAERDGMVHDGDTVEPVEAYYEASRASARTWRPGGHSLSSSQAVVAFQAPLAPQHQAG